MIRAGCEAGSLCERLWGLRGPWRDEPGDSKSWGGGHAVRGAVNLRGGVHAKRQDQQGGTGGLSSRGGLRRPSLRVQKRAVPEPPLWPARDTLSTCGAAGSRRARRAGRSGAGHGFVGLCVRRRATEVLSGIVMWVRRGGGRSLLCGEARGRYDAIITLGVDRPAGRGARNGGLRGGWVEGCS